MERLVVAVQHLGPIIISLIHIDAIGGRRQVDQIRLLRAIPFYGLFVVEFQLVDSVRNERNVLRTLDAAPHLHTPHGAVGVPRVPRTCALARRSLCQTQRVVHCVRGRLVVSLVQRSVSTALSATRSCLLHPHRAVSRRAHVAACEHVAASITTV